MKPRLLAACYRSPYLAMAVLQGDEVIEVRRHRLGRHRAKAVVRQHIATLANAYHVNRVTVEPATLAHRALMGTAHTRVRLVSLKAVKDQLLPELEARTNSALMARLIADHPQWRRLFRHWPKSGLMATTDTWRTVALLAIALGLAEASQT